MYNPLFSPARIGNLEIKNRVVMTAMGNHLAGEQGFMSDESVAFYAARAKGGVGLIITECVIVDYERGKGNLRQIAASDDKYLPGLKRLAEEIHKNGAKAVVQLYHPGRQGISAINGNLPMAAPSEVECQAVHQPVYAMSKEDIRQMVDKFRQAARRVKQAGFDGLELHGAHGYLITQFLSPYTNRRTDEYGGSLANRMRFLEELVAAVQAECGADYPLLVRISAEEFLEAVGKPGQGLHLDETVQVARRLEEIGVQAIDVSAGIYETMNVSWEPISFDQGWKSYLPATIKKNVSIPVIGTCVIRDPQFAEDLISSGKLDFAGSARTHYADPEWSAKAEAGKAREIRRCISCLYCMQMLMEADVSGQQMGCSINIQSGRERDLCSFKEDGAGRVVAVIGGGPAGLEAARVLARRKFKPVLFEKSDRLGGQLNYADKPPKKEKIDWLIDYLRKQMEVLGVEVRLNRAPGLGELKALNPYAVFVAQGSLPLLPRAIPGLDGPHVYTPPQILSGQVKLSGKKVCVVGSGMTGIETAWLLGSQGNEIHVYEMADAIGPGLFFQNLIDVMDNLKEYSPGLYPKHKLVKIQGTTVTFEQTDSGSQISRTFDEIVISLGTRPNTELAEEIKNGFKNVRFLGDAAKPGRIRNAMEAGFTAAFEL